MNKKFTILIVAGIFVAALLGGSQPTHAWQAPANIKTKPLQTTPIFLDKIMTAFGMNKKKNVLQVKKAKYTIHNDETFKEHTHKVHMRPYNNPHLDFAITVPKNWQEQNLALRKSMQEDSDIIDDVAKFSSEMISVFRAHITVSIKV